MTSRTVGPDDDAPGRPACPANGEEPDPFSWVGMGESDALRGTKVDDLLAQGFGR